MDFNFLIKIVSGNPIVFLVLVTITYRIILLPIYIIRYKNNYFNNILKKYINKYNISRKKHKKSIKKIKRDIGIKNTFFMFILFLFEIFAIYNLFDLINYVKNKELYIFYINLEEVKCIIYILYIIVMSIYEYIYFKYKIKHDFLTKKQLKFEIVLSSLFLSLIFYFARNYELYLLIYFIISYIVFIIIKKNILECLVFKNISYFDENFISKKVNNQLGGNYVCSSNQ